MHDKLKIQIIDFLLLQSCAHKSINGRELQFRCPFCGDSHKSSNSTNFSVKIDTEGNKAMSYQCFRAECLARGVVDQDFLAMLGYDKHDVIMELNKYNKKSNRKKADTLHRYKKELVNVVNVDNPMNTAKLAYINKRLGLNLSMKDIYDLKINLDVTHLMNFNKVQIGEKKVYRYKLFSLYGVGFISTYNDYVIVRDFSRDGKLGKRYTNENIFDNYVDATKIYNIPTKIDIVSDEQTVLNISEGAFDILGVYYHLDIDREYKNQLFVAASGAGIANVVMHFVRMYGLLDLKINIFADSDTKLSMFNGLKKLKPYLNDFNISIYYNTLSKDFGVCKSDISYEVYKLE
jgi:hypothetical protein